MTVTKADLINEIYKTHQGMSKSQAAESVETFLSLSKSALIAGNGLLLSKFGKFHVKDKRSRKGRNPRTGDVLIIDERRVVTFSTSLTLRSRVNP